MHQQNWMPTKAIYLTTKRKATERLLFVHFRGWIAKRSCRPWKNPMTKTTQKSKNLWQTCVQSAWKNTKREKQLYGHLTKTAAMRSIEIVWLTILWKWKRKTHTLAPAADKTSSSTRRTTKWPKKYDALAAKNKVKKNSIQIQLLVIQTTLIWYSCTITHYSDRR